MDYGWLPPQWASIERALRTYGGWSRMFSRSALTYDAEHIVYRDNQVGFWEEFAKVKGEEQFREEVESCVDILKQEHGDKRKKKELRILIAKELSRQGWSPIITHIKKEIADIIRQKKADIRLLKNSK